jgi:hypothetical protein
MVAIRLRVTLFFFDRNCCIDLRYEGSSSVGQLMEDRCTVVYTCQGNLLYVGTQIEKMEGCPSKIDIHFELFLYKNDNDDGKFASSPIMYLSEYR